ncbi:TlpA family protein disulfide reductase [Aliifodinibius sp. S!AR15-10]|uniref:TlpA disulfide reductase family protein n=1 Tax=Aliifodinibius sp. S!AR15-10 TaxID=2950437 RepID=UPI00285AA2E2|nr:TlpA disulfide reductase family protein [Aliifodinibius sp. S!AR15-10]MDR8390479.1 TlpA family protein disulfide reductase [Aliifodinibius sp. S!AR15-10]
MKYLILTGLLVFLSACGAKQNESRQQARQNESGSAQRVERLDPYSAPLHRAQKKATATDFEVTLLNGETFRLSEQKGKVVLINIWATWCPPCRDETPDLVDLHEKYKDEGYLTLGVSIDEQGESVVRPFMEEYGVTYPMYIDSDGTVMEKYGPTMGIPTTYIIGRQGNLRYFAVGAVTKKELEPRIKELLAEGN